MGIRFFGDTGVIRYSGKTVIEDKCSGGKITLDAFVEFPSLDQANKPLEQYHVGDCMYFAIGPGDLEYDTRMVTESLGRLNEIIYSPYDNSSPFCIAFEPLYQRSFDLLEAFDQEFLQWYEVIDEGTTYPSNLLRMVMKVSETDFNNALKGNSELWTPYSKIWKPDGGSRGL